MKTVTAVLQRAEDEAFRLEREPPLDERQSLQRRLPSDVERDDEAEGSSRTTVTSYLSDAEQDADADRSSMTTIFFGINTIVSD